jgi:hypothetical protein
MEVVNIRIDKYSVSVIKTVPGEKFHELVERKKPELINQYLDRICDILKIEHENRTVMVQVFNIAETIYLSLVAGEEGTTKEELNGVSEAANRIIKQSGTLMEWNRFVVPERNDDDAKIYYYKIDKLSKLLDLPKGYGGDLMKDLKGNYYIVSENLSYLEFFKEVPYDISRLQMDTVDSVEGFLHKLSV